MSQIVSLDQYIAAQKQRIPYIKTGTKTTVAAIPFTLYDSAGNPGAGVIATTSGSQATIQTDAITGFPAITFTSGSGYLTRVEFGSTVACRFAIYDMLTKSGSYMYPTGASNITAPDISSRCPDYTGGATYGVGNEIWAEVTLPYTTGNSWQLQTSYVNQSGTTASTTISAAQAAAALTQGKMFQLPLSAGDSGVQGITRAIVTNGGTAMTTGAFNLLLMRPLWTSGRVRSANDGDIHDLLKTGMPIVYNSSALYVLVQTDSTSSGTPELIFEISSA